MASAGDASLDAEVVRRIEEVRARADEFAAKGQRVIASVFAKGRAYTLLFLQVRDKKMESHVA